MEEVPALKPDSALSRVTKQGQSEISPAIKQYFADMGIERVRTFLATFQEGGFALLKKNIIEGNLAYVIHLMQTAQMNAGGYSYTQMVLDHTSNDPLLMEKGGKALEQFMVSGLQSAAKYEKIDQSLPQGAQDILDILFPKKS